MEVITSTGLAVSLDRRANDLFINTLFLPEIQGTDISTTVSVTASTLLEP
ncbi:MAG: hypothetical protein ABI866_09740 [Dokdonella sp.]